MNGKCAKCGREREGDRYKIYLAKVTNQGGRSTYSDLRVEHFFICNPCARMGKAGLYRPVLIIFALMGLPMLEAAIGTMSQNGFGDGVVYLFFGLLLLAPAAWAAYSLITTRPTEENGESAALRPAFLQLRASGQWGQALIAPADMKKLVKTQPDLQLELLMLNLTGGAPPAPAPASDFTEGDLPAIREYLHFLAQQWWETEGAEPAVCERCNGEVPRGYGCLMGASLYHAHCFDSLLDESLPYLRQNPNFLGQGVLQKARELAANKQPAP